MKRLILAVALAAGCTLASSAPALAAAKNYDCSKPGNANKAACKTAAKSATAAAAKATPAKPASKPMTTKVASTTTTKTATRKNYDCSKPGNANKVVCKSAATTAPKPVATPKAAAAPPARKVAASAPASAEDKNPAGAIAQCKDGTYSHSKVRSGACSRHGGVAKWS